MSVKHLERLVTDKQGQGGSFQNQGSSRPVRERLGRKSGISEGFGGRDVEDGEEIGREDSWRGEVKYLTINLVRAAMK